MQTMKSLVAVSLLALLLLAVGGLLSVELRAADTETVFPGKAWATKTPAEVGLDVDKLKEFSQFVGGRGCVVRHGYMVFSSGDVSHRADVASACKPFYSHFLFKAVEDPDNQTDHFGSYSWLWWINGVDRNGTRFWPGAPHDTYGAFGHGGPRSMWVIPSMDIVVSYNDAKLR